MIVIDRSKAEGSTLDRLRSAREPLLAELDVQFMRALETGQDTGAIVDDKQALRDVTAKNFDALTIGQLATLTIHDALALP